MRDARMIFLRNGANPVAFVREPAPTKHNPNGSGGALMEAAFTPTRADDKGRTRSSLEATQSAADPNPPQEWISLSLEKEVLNRRVRTGGLPPGYIDQ